MSNQQNCRLDARFMNFIDVTLSTPADNLACDEALLDSCESGESGEVLRFWEPDSYFVVVGYANSVDVEAHVAACQANAIPILRRCSGGGTVLQGPGCLNYSLILRTDPKRSLDTIAGTNQVVMSRMRDTLSRALGVEVLSRGQTDLAIGGLKCCGNAQRRKRTALIFHGCFLLRMDIGMIEKVLPMPSQQPDYRSSRSHRDFLKNLGVEPGVVKRALIDGWDAKPGHVVVPTDLIKSLVAEKYGREAWNRKR
jgi:lipoate---protein ligase